MLHLTEGVRTLDRKEKALVGNHAACIGASPYPELPPLEQGISCLDKPFAAVFLLPRTGFLPEKLMGWFQHRAGFFPLSLCLYGTFCKFRLTALRRSAGSRSLRFLFRFVLRAFLPFSFLFAQKHGDNFILPGRTRGVGTPGISALAGVSRSYGRIFRI